MPARLGTPRAFRPKVVEVTTSLTAEGAHAHVNLLVWTSPPSLSIASAKACARGNFSAAELTAEALRFAEAENPKTNAYLHFSPERALANAKRVDEQLARGEDPGPLAGVPVAVKDVIVTKGVRTTCGSKLLAQLHSAVRRHGCHSFGTGGRYPDRQNQLRRVRHGIVQRKLGIRTGAQSGGARSRARRIERRIGGGGGARHGGGLAGLRYRRLGSPAGVVLRRGGRHADLRARVALRA